ncbi:hypothetical protein HQ865_25235 [Mucilaginibacter mali]|uniref:Uncharacterized protein n=1 Tax=Mucilaginibacter mali TaxID=2740462 RepID=A0A7D4TY50_9SPHI|nr:hypothetical protein [Mucilaginibacter mali]QKJ32915.1 hypothetical protein HQ865_25235 [Mucilaginibacter mali]
MQVIIHGAVLFTTVEQAPVEKRLERRWCKGLLLLVLKDTPDMVTGLSFKGTDLLNLKNFLKVTLRWM